MNTQPEITAEEAKTIFAGYKKIPPELVTDYRTELMIKEIPLRNDTLPALVFSVLLFADHPDNNEFGFVDAHNGKVVYTMPTSTSISALGTFDTRYSGTRQAHTDAVGINNFRLYNDTRGPAGKKTTIRTLNLNGSSTIPSNPGSSYEFTDNDNNWTAAEYNANKNDMALDIHWALQQIYDRLYNAHGVNSIDNNGHSITAYFKHGIGDNAAWSISSKVVYFGVGGTTFKPLASVDVVAHELGHGITHFNHNWSSYSHFNEGMSDIWAAIMKYRITPNQPTWLIGNQIMNNNTSCLRDLEKTNNVNAFKQIANTYDPSSNSQYTKGDEYVKGGVFSHWFYLLANGGKSTNGLGNAYTVHGVGMDIAEKLIVKAVFNGSLNNSTSWADIRFNLLQVALTIDHPSTLQYGILAQQVDNAWYAVGVGLQPATQIALNNSNTLRCSGQTVTYSVNGFPVGNYTWSGNSSNLAAGATSGNSKTFTAGSGSGLGWVQISCDHGITIRNENLWVGPPALNLLNGEGNIQNGVYDWYSTSVVSNFSAPSDYEWWLDPFYSNNYLIYNGFVASVNINETDQYQLFCRAQNTCGWGSHRYIRIYASRGSSSSGGYFYPNPVDDILTIDIGALAGQFASGSLRQAPSYDVRLYNGQGNLLRQQIAKGGTVQFNVSNLPDGIYYLHIYNEVKSTPEIQQIMVEH